jgi:hypothetical protein
VNETSIASKRRNPEQSTIDPTQMRSTWRALLQNIELMPQH